MERVPRPFRAPQAALGECGRAYGTNCIHEHSCLRCSLLRPDPAQRPRLIGIRDNLRNRITEAQRERWLGEAERLKVSLAAATAKLTQMEELAARRQASIDLAMPRFPDAAGRTITTAAAIPASKETR